MAELTRTTLQLPIQNSVVSAADRVVFIYSAANSSAQTSSITIQHLFANTPNLQVAAANLNLTLVGSDPADSNATSVTAGQFWFTNSYIYVAVANNYVRRVAIADF